MARSRIVKLELEDGTVAELTMNFKDLFDLRNEEPELYSEYRRVFNDGIHDILDNVTILYTAYRCANNDNPMTFHKFLSLVPFDIPMINDTINKLLTSDKKKPGSQNLSKERPNEGNRE